MHTIQLLPRFTNNKFTIAELIRNGAISFVSPRPLIRSFVIYPPPAPSPPPSGHRFHLRYSALAISRFEQWRSKGFFGGV